VARVKGRRRRQLPWHSYPGVTGDSHSSGYKRALNVQQGCDAVTPNVSADE